jgi:hypothetical protein
MCRTAVDLQIIAVCIHTAYVTSSDSVHISFFRYQEEDKDLEAQMLAKGLRLTPLRKESHV